MKLTTSEQDELNRLIDMKSSKTAMMQYQFERMNYLKFKSLKNTCPNTRCIGYDGSDLDVVCPNCGRMLIK